MGMARRVLVVAGVLVMLAGVVFVGVVDAAGEKVTAAGGGSGSRSWHPGGGRLPLVLFFDDGTYENGLGFSDYDGQWNVAFGGSPPSTGAVPFQVLAGFWLIYPGYPGQTQAVFNVHATANSQIFSSPAPAGTGTQSWTGTGPVINNVGGSVFAGVGGNGPSIWFIGMDTTGPAAGRQWAGGGMTGNLNYSPAYWSGIGFANNWMIRLAVDGNIPVELESFDIE